MSAADENTDADGKKIKKGTRTAYDVQRNRLEKLMKDPAKPVFIPEPRKEKDPNKAPDFVYNVMGSSAGAGSGEFHIYRAIRRKEALRQEVLGEQREKIDLNDAYHQKLAENERLAQERTAKKRAKRLKKKGKKKKTGQTNKQESSSSKRLKKKGKKKKTGQTNKQESSSSEEESETEHKDRQIEEDKK